jgi:aminoglycoside 2''-phosphotransferase
MIPGLESKEHEKMDKRAIFLPIIQETYPDLAIRSARFHNSEGQFSEVLIINEDTIFRFPRYPDGIESILGEVHILSRIQGCTTLPIPNPIYTSRDACAVGKVFMGYRMLPGEPLWLETFQCLDDETQGRLAAQLASFLRELHRIPVERLGTGLPIQDGPEEWASLYAEIRQHLFPWMRLDAREWVTNHFETYLNTTTLHIYEPVLRHGDFGTCNILYDRATQAIGGVIDFGFAGIGDPALDIAAISRYGETFMGRFSDTYPEIDFMLERARFYTGTYALQEALHGFKKGDQGAFESGMALYI